MRCNRNSILLGMFALCGLHTAFAQDFYDTTILRTVNIQFHDSNWLTLLRQNYQSQTDILADLTVDGVTYPDVGVRIRGNTSYTALPAGSLKFSLNISVDSVHADQDIMGYDSLNFNNGFHDPTFCREVVYNNFVAQFIPNPRANHIVLTLNGENWGVYVNVQQFDKRMLAPFFPDTNGLRIKCANNPNGPGLRYNGTNPSGYTGYEIKDDGGLADPWGALIAVCNSVTNEPLATWPNIDGLFAIDPSIWSVVLENMLTDDDSYVNKGADFVTYRNPNDGRMFLLQTDANETFTQATWTVTRNFTQTNKPVLNHVLAVAELRQRFMAHYRTARSNLNWAYFEPIFTTHRNLIDAAVQADTKRLYSYQLFQQNFTQTVTLPYSGPAGGTLIGLQQFVDQRANFLNTNAELIATGPSISNVHASSDSPDPADPVFISADVSATSGPITRVELFYRPNPTSRFLRVLMSNVGGNTYSAPLPITASAGQRVDYYVGAVSGNSYSSWSFSPARTEWNPLRLEYTFGSEGGMRITEWMYSGTSGEFIEFTNMSDEAIDMTGYSFDDDHATAGAFGLSALGIVQPGESVVITEAQAETFRAAWGLAPTVKIIGSLGATSGNNLARNDEINLYDGDDNLVDRLTYGDQTYPGTPRTQNASGQTCRESIGQNEVGDWELSAIGDEYGTFTTATGERGTPGVYTQPSCNPCTAPQISTQPVSRVVCATSPASYSVISSGSGPLGYQWQIEEAPSGSGNFVDLVDGPLSGVATISGAETASLSLTDLVPTASSTFRCIVANDCGTETSTAATLYVQRGPAGDLNCDGLVNNFDIDAFVLSLTDTEAYAAAYPSCDVYNGDANCDGAVNNFDIDPFVECLANGGCP